MSNKGKCLITLIVICVAMIIIGAVLLGVRELLFPFDTIVLGITLMALGVLGAIVGLPTIYIEMDD